MLGVVGWWCENNAEDAGTLGADSTRVLKELDCSMRCFDAILR